MLDVAQRVQKLQIRLLLDPTGTDGNFSAACSMRTFEVSYESEQLALYCDHRC